MKQVLAIYMFALAVQAAPIYGQVGVDVQSIPFDMGTVVDDGDAGDDNKLFDMGTTESPQIERNAEAALAGQPSSGTTPGYRVEDALPSCERYLSGETDQDAIFCAAFFLGTKNVMTYNCVAAESGANSLNMLSTNPGYSTEGAIQAFINYARARPEHWGFTMGTLAPAALALTFPCEATSN